MSKTLALLLALACVSANVQVALAARPISIAEKDHAEHAVAVAPYMLDTSATLLNSDQIAIRGEYPLCASCVQFAVMYLNVLVNAIVQRNIEHGCSEVCDLLPGKLEQTVCRDMCDTVGIAAFVEAIVKSDIDFIYFCELIDKTGLTVCPIQDCPAADPQCVTLETVNVSPQVGSNDAIYTFSVGLNATAPTGTGMTRIHWTAVGTGAHGVVDGLYLGFAEGPQTMLIGMNAYTAGKADGSGQHQPLQLGRYIVQVEICEGSCPANGEKPHQANFGSLNTTFTINHAVAPPHR